MSKRKQKTLLLLLAVILILCGILAAVLLVQRHTENIQATEAVILSVDEDSVTSLSWTYGSTSLSFTRGSADEDWQWDEDAAFPVSSDAMNDLLAPFENLSAAFAIEDAEDLGQYGLSDPEAVITLTADGVSYTLRVGDYSTMDEERYVTLGDGTVYLTEYDPLEDYDAELEDVFRYDTLPDLSEAQEISFTGADSYTVTRDEDKNTGYSEADIYYADDTALDSTRVTSYLSTLDGLGLTKYMTYTASEDDLTRYGLDNPEFTVTVNYTDAESDDDTVQTFALQVSRNAEEAAEYEEAVAAADEDETGDIEAPYAYVRIEGSENVYRISADAYTSLAACTENDLRHHALFSADFDSVTAIEITLDGESYTLTADGEGDDRKWYLDGDTETEIGTSDLSAALTGLNASAFTEEKPSGKQEIALTLTTDIEAHPTVAIALYRYNGSYCLATLDGEPFALVPRSSAVDLTEAVNGIVLGD